MMYQQFRCSLFAGVLLGCCLTALARDPVPGTLPATPDGTVKSVVQAIGEGKFEVLWQALPASYQADVKKLIVEFSKKMDAELWEQGSNVAGKVAKLFTDKADFIIGNQIVAQQLQAKSIKPEDAKQYLTAIGGMLLELQKDAATLSDVEKLNVEKLLANIGPKFRDLNDASARVGVLPQGANMNELLKLEVKLIRSESDTASLEVTQADGKKKNGGIRACRRQMDSQGDGRRMASQNRRCHERPRSNADQNPNKNNKSS
jgi:hypothetical protein